MTQAAITSMSGKRAAPAADRRRGWRGALLGWATIACVAASAGGDEPKAGVQPGVDPDRIRLLVRKLDADRREERDAATDALVQLGPEILKQLPSIEDKSLSAEQRQRIRRIMPRLWKARLDVDIAGRVVDLGGKPMPLLEAIKVLGVASGNRVVDMREQFNQDVTDPTVDLKKGGFWKTLDDLAAQARLSCYFATEDRSIGLIGRPKKMGPIGYSGAFRFELQRLALEQPLDDPDAKPHAIAKLEVAFEPRLRPILVEIDSEAIRGVDDKGRTVEYTGQRDISFPVDRDAYVFPLSFKLASPKRDAIKLAKLQGRVIMSLPIHVERFEFADMPTDKPIEKLGPGLKVTFAKFAAQDGTWTVSATYEAQGEGGQVDSHFRSALEVEVFLENKVDGKRFKQNGGLNTVADEPGKTSVDYLFVDAPGKPADYRLVVNAPTGIGRVPVPFAFDNIPLP